MRIQLTLFLAALLPPLFAEELHSQDGAKQVIRQYKSRIAAANKAYEDFVEAAKEKKKTDIAAATQAVIATLRDELEKTGPGDIARAIELAKRIYQLDSTDKTSRKILLEANIALDRLEPSGDTKIPPPKPRRAPADEKTAAGAVPTVKKSAPLPDSTPQENPPGFGAQSGEAAAASGNYPIQKNKRPLTLPGGAYSALGELERRQTASSGNPCYLNYGVDYGISDGFQVGFNHSLRLSSGIDITEAPFTLNSSVAHKFDFGGSNLSAGIRASLPLYLEGNVLQNISFGLPCRFNFANDRVAVWLGERPGMVARPGGYYNEGILNFGITGEEFVVLNLPVGMSFQVSEELNLGLFTRLYQYYSHENDPAHYTYNLGNYRPFNLLASYAIDPASEIFIGFDYDGFVGAGFSNWSLSFGYIFRGF